MKQVITIITHVRADINSCSLATLVFLPLEGNKTIKKNAAGHVSDKSTNASVLKTFSWCKHTGCYKH